MKNVINYARVAVIGGMNKEFDSLEAAQRFLFENGWRDIHQGNWRAAHTPGVIRFIIKNPEGKFQVRQKASRQ
jgi:hypothetical protein